MTAASGRLICLEGIEGTGKTTHARFIAHLLEARGISVLVTREPGGTERAEAIRELILKPEWPLEPLTPEAELLLLFAARAQHIAHCIQPALRRGQWVLCDRFTEASYAYQGGGRGLPVSWIDCLTACIQKHLVIDRVLLLDAPPQQALERLQKRSAHLDRIELEQIAFFERVRVAYQARAAKYPERYRVIDATLPLQAVQRQIQYALADL